MKEEWKKPHTKQYWPNPRLYYYFPQWAEVNHGLKHSEEPKTLPVFKLSLPDT
jgi:hypothetical protein